MNNKYKYSFEYKGFNCYVYPMCGYVHGFIEIPKDHKFNNILYYELNTFLEAHGGLTYSIKGADATPINKEIDPESWVIGFDTNHCFDDETTQTNEFVKEELKSIVNQIRLNENRLKIFSVSFDILAPNENAVMDMIEYKCIDDYEFTIENKKG